MAAGQQCATLTLIIQHNALLLAASLACCCLLVADEQHHAAFEAATAATTLLSFLQFGTAAAADTYSAAWNELRLILTAITSSPATDITSEAALYLWEACARASFMTTPWLGYRFQAAVDARIGCLVPQPAAMRASTAAWNRYPSQGVVMKAARAHASHRHRAASLVMAVAEEEAVAVTTSRISLQAAV
ncbi:hypothetical protein D9Q98_009408 [Chlorella vulgaris]|uniref:Uncharacterized protein n=1 Tax=Chlorella vulgaris TaxID=3077 RepID=A0A9D4YX09_CHLVU|nr:hypothetical protein D9Q98_010694 [Chlorella vulgaris]KAI3431006.1 hypothetical protein D9Q98_009408 [Chlorella vulgaris]